jgi:hypothetical protein
MGMMHEIVNVCSIMFRKPLRKQLLGRPRRIFEDNISINFTETEGN